MHEFETFVYLDVPKTGTSFIASVLKKFSKERLVKKVLHTGVEMEYDASKFHFISVRDPFQQYLSLYSFGCQSKGKLFTRLSKGGFAGLYDGSPGGFSDWLAFILEPRSAGFLPEFGDHNLRHIAGMMGFQSYRVLQLAMSDAENVLARCSNREEVEAAFKSRNIVQYTIKTETLRTDLDNLLVTRLAPSMRNLRRARRYIAEESARNTSHRVDEMWPAGADTDLRSLVL